MAGLVVTTPPADEPIGMAEAKDFLRVDDQVDERIIRMLIIAARQWAENYTGRALMEQTLTLSLNGLREVDYPLWEGMREGPDITYKYDRIDLPRAPLISVNSVKTYDDQDNATVFAATNYYVDTARNVGQIVLRDTSTFPTGLRAANAIVIEYKAGYGDEASDVPEAIRLAMLQYMTFSYEHRGDFERFPAPNAPASIETLLQPYRIMGFSRSAFSGVI